MPHDSYPAGTHAVGPSDSVTTGTLHASPWMTGEFGHLRTTSSTGDGAHHTLSSTLVVAVPPPLPQQTRLAAASSAIPPPLPPKIPAQRLLPTSSTEEILQRKETRQRENKRIATILGSMFALWLLGAGVFLYLYMAEYLFR